MPRIREIVAESSTRAAIPGGGASPLDAGAGVGAAIERLGETIGKVAEHYDKARRDTMLGAATAQATQELQEFSFTLQNGAIDDEGNVVPPPDPTTHFDAYNRKAQEIRDRVKGQLGDDRLYGLFEQDFGKVALRQSFEVRKNVIERQREAAVADFDRMEDTLADTAARGDDFVRKQSVELFRGQLGKFVAAGLVKATDAQKREEKFLGMIDRAQIREAIRTSPEQAITALLSKDAFPNIPPDQRETYLKLATGESERRLRAQTAEDERLRRERERAEKDTQDTVFKDAMDLAAQGKLNLKWVQANRAHIAKADYDNLVKIAVKGGGLKSGEGGEGNTAVYIDLRDRVSRGEDVRADAKRAFANGQIKLQMFNTLMNETETRAADGNGAYRDGVQYIKTALAPSPTNPKLTGMAQANALDDWQEWSRANPNASRDEANTRAREIAERYHMVAVNEMTIGRPRPYRHAGGAQVDEAAVRASLDALVKDRAEGRITPEQYNREVRNLQVWRQAAGRAAAAPAGGAPKSGKSGGKQ